MTTKDEIIKKLEIISKKDLSENQKVIQQFIDASLDLKVAFMAEVLRSYDCLPKFSTASTKIDSKSMEYRRLGNQAYKVDKESSDIVALRCYLLSIAYARDDSEELAIAYANRSAILYRLEKFRFALVDVNRALNGKLPSALRQKLIERKKKCIRNIREDNSVEMMLAQLHTAHLDPYSQCILYSTLKKNHEVQIDEVENLRVRKPEIPTLLRKNYHFPSLSKKIDVVEDLQKKRSLIANTNIELGDLLLVERPYASILSPKYAQTHCAHCFTRTLTLIPCNGCSKVMFCGKKCQEEALISFHRVECQIMPTLLRLQLSDKEILALRMLLIATKQGEDLKDLLSYVVFENASESKKLPPKKKQKKNASKRNKKTPLSLWGPKRDVRKPPKNVHDRVRMLEDGLDILLQKEKINQFSYRAIVAAILLHVLKSSSYFTKTVQHSLGKETIPEEIQQLIGSLLLKNLLVLDLNGEQMVEWIESLDGVNHELKHIGEALYPTFSFINHSCDPNVVKFSHQDCIVVRAIQPIVAGEEVLTCYGECFGIHPREKRQEHCKKFYFECKCDPCEFNWPLYTQLPVTKPILLSEDKTNLASFQKDILHLRRMKTNEDHECTEHFEEFARKFTSWAHKNIKKPWKDYYDCIEMYKSMMISKANFYSPEVYPLIEIDA